jgi:hypothetical protein
VLRSFVSSEYPATKLFEFSSVKSKSKLLYDWRFTANQFVLASSLLRLTTRFFSTEPLRYQSLCNILSQENMSSTLMNMLVLSSSVHVAYIASHRKFFLLHYIQVLCQYRLCKPDHAYLTYLMLQRQLGHLNVRNLDQARLPHFLDNRLTDGGEVVSLTRRPPFIPRKIPGTHFC